MSFGKPPNPLLVLVNPAHEAFHINKIEADMRGEGGVTQRCGCRLVYTSVMVGTLAMRVLRPRIVSRCDLHKKYSEY